MVVIGFWLLYKVRKKERTQTQTESAFAVWQRCISYDLAGFMQKHKDESLKFILTKKGLKLKAYKFTELS